MLFKEEFDRAFEFVRSAFPFDQYMDVATYYETYAVVAELHRHWPHFHGKQCLDIGCGPMDKTAMLQRLGFSCCAVDDLGDPWHQRGDNNRLIKEFAATIGIDFYQQPVDDHTIPFKKGRFDVVCALGVIEHLHESPRNLLNTMGGYLRSGGLLVLLMPNAVNLRKRLSVLAGRTNYVPVDQFFHSAGTWRGHVREYTLDETKYICREAGFQVRSARTYESLAQRKLKSPVRQIYQLLGKVIPGSQSGLLVVAQKPEGWQVCQPNAAAFRKASERSVPPGAA